MINLLSSIMKFFTSSIQITLVIPLSIQFSDRLNFNPILINNCQLNSSKI